MKHIILKVDGSVLTQKYGEDEANEEVIKNLARVISKAWKHVRKNLILVHGMGSFAHRLILAYGISNGAKTDRELLGASYVHASAVYLSGILTEMLINKSVPAIHIPITCLARTSNKRVLKFDTSYFETYMNKGFLPITHGDLVIDSKRGVSEISSTEIMYKLSKSASRIVLAVDGNCALDENGKIVKKITPKDLKSIYESTEKNGERNVASALKGILENKRYLKGKKIMIVNGRKAERIEEAIRGTQPTVSTVIEF